MSRRLSFILGLCFFLCASCASEPQPFPRTGYDDLAEEQEVEREPAPQQATTTAAPDTAPTTQQGPIDLGMGDGDDPNGAEIVINRPDNDTADLDEDAQDAPDSKTYEQACESVDQCEDLEELECAGSMACVDKRCVYTCDADDEADADNFEDDLEEDVEIDELAD